jgi:hypothetical protein
VSQPRRARLSSSLSSSLSTSLSTSLRPIGLPRALVVREDGHQMPLAVTRTDVHGYRGREARVESIEEVWRLAEAWWREASQARTYYRVILEGGRPLTLFRDDSAGTWSEQPYTSPGTEGAR